MGCWWPGGAGRADWPEDNTHLCLTCLSTSPEVAEATESPGATSLPYPLLCICAARSLSFVGSTLGEEACAGRKRCGERSARNDDIAASVCREQRCQLGIVVSLAGGQLQRCRCAEVVEEAVNLGRPPAAGAAERVISRLAGQILVIRHRPLCAARRARRQRAGGPGRLSNRPTPTRPPPDHRRCRCEHVPPRTSPHTFRRSTSAGAVPKPIATHQVQAEYRATANRCETARRSLPASFDDHSTADPAAAPTTAAPAQSTSTTNQKSHLYESHSQHQTATAK